MRKRLTGLLLAGAMVLCLGLGALPRKAQAAPPTKVMVAGTDVVSGSDVTYWLVNATRDGITRITNSGAGSGNYNVKYDPSGVLTLKNAEFTYLGTASAGILVGAAGDLTIEYSGNNSVTGKQYGVSVNDNLLIQAGESGATLNAVGQEAPGDSAYGIRSMNQSVTIKGGSVTATGGTGSNTYGIEARNGGIRITGSRVTADGGDGEYGSIGMRAASSGGITVEQDSHLIAKGKNQALSVAPNLAGNGGYEWRTDPRYAFSPAPYVWLDNHIYVEIAARPATASVPQTGDGAMPLLWTGLLALSGAGLAASALRRRKREK